ncbi:plasmid recombination protein, partial [Lutimaribacter marinistellae]
MLRFEGLYPHQLAGYEAHRLRKGGDLSHVDKSRSELNQRLIGPEDWAAQALEEIREMATENFAAELESLEKRNRKKDIERRMVEGPKQPWRQTRHGPMREVILTVNKDWFEGNGAASGQEQKEREELFGELARVWLIKSFGDDVIHARADRDEVAYHIHAVIMPRATVEIAKPKAKVKTASATRRMLQPSIRARPKPRTPNQETGKAAATPKFERVEPEALQGRHLHFSERPWGGRTAFAFAKGQIPLPQPTILAMPPPVLPRRLFYFLASPRTVIVCRALPKPLSSR